jgi:hypothetical protein
VPDSVGLSTQFINNITEMSRDNRSIDRKVKTQGLLRDRDMVMDECRVSVSWCEGGVSMFTGAPRSKGYKIYVTPCHTEYRDGHAITQSILMSGTRVSGLSYSIESANRYNAKRLQYHADRIDAQKVADWYEQGNDQAIQDYVRQDWNTEIGQKLGYDKLISVAV